MSPVKMVIGIVPSKSDLSSCQFMIHLSIVYASLLCSLPLVLVETSQMPTLLGKSCSFCSSSVLLEKCFMFYEFPFPPDVYVGTLRLTASIPCASILILHPTVLYSSTLVVVSRVTCLWIASEHYE